MKLGAVVLAAVTISGLAFVSDAQESPAVHRIKVQPDKAPDCSSLSSIIQSVTRDCKTNDEKAIAIYHFMNLTQYHQNYPSESGGIGALKAINVYGWSLCGGLHSIQAALWREMGWEWRFVGWSDPGHTTVEARYDGKWHYVDVFLRYYAWKNDPAAPRGKTIASEEDLKNDPSLITNGIEFDNERKVYYFKGNSLAKNAGANWRAPALLVCGDEPPGIVTGTKSSRSAGSPTGWNAINFDSPGYSTDINLPAGSSLTLTWDPIKDAQWWSGRKYTPGHGCGDKDYRNCPAIGPVLEPYRQRRSYANGTFIFAPDFSKEGVLSSFAATNNVKLADGKLVPANGNQPASVTIALQLPYVMTRAYAQVDGADSTEISLDAGKTWKTVDLKDFSDAIGGKYSCLLRLGFKDAIKSLRVETIVQCNRCALPYLSPGKNRVEVSVADPKEVEGRKLVITYAYQTGVRTRSYEDLASTGHEIARAHAATWSTTPTIVRKVFTAKDLPATFDIDIPTPRDKYPVYPRMLFIQREVLPANASPLPLPAGAMEPVTGPNDELKTLPSPFTVGFPR